MAMLSDEQFGVLCGCGIFTDADEDVIRRSVASEDVYLHSFVSGDVVMSPSDGEHMLGVMLCGTAQVTKQARGGVVVMSVLGAGSAFGAATLFANGCALTRVAAKSAVTAVIFSEAAFTRLMRESFDVTCGYCRYLTERIRFLTNRVECMAGGTVADKLMSYFEKNAVEGVVRLQYGMDSLAKAVSVSRASLYRALGELEAAGMVTRNGREIKIIGY